VQVSPFHLLPTVEYVSTSWRSIKAVSNLKVKTTLNFGAGQPPPPPHRYMNSIRVFFYLSKVK
jgi:hypothetical protein